MRSKNIKRCGNCNFCKLVYDRTSLRFWARNDYCCTACQKITQKSDLCDNWQKREKPNFDLSPQRFREAENDINFLLDALKDYK